MSKPVIAAGSLLIASPILRDPNFARSIVLLCEHSDKGSMGLIVNRPSEKSVAEALSGVEKLPPAEERLFLGGPVQPEILLVLHRLAAPPPGAQPVTGGMALGGDMQTLVDLLAAKRSPEDRLRVFAGYAGWGEGQLDAEMSSGSWFSRPASSHIVFDMDPTTMWTEVIRSLGPEYEHYVTMPADPRVN